MNLRDFIVIGVIIAVAAIAFYLTSKGKNKNGCCGNCRGCSAFCNTKTVN